MKIFSYVLRYDDGAAPNPYWGICTLTICKPDIRKAAQVGDWVIGTGSTNSRLKDGKTHDLSKCLVYAMKVEKVMSLEKYDEYCNKSLKKKIPNLLTSDYREKLGDCIYDYSNPKSPIMRKGVHDANDSKKRIELMKTDLSGKNALLSQHFYYFGEAAVQIPDDLTHIIKKMQKHKIITDPVTHSKFEKWIAKYELKKKYGEPQLAFEHEKEQSEKLIDRCAQCHWNEELNNC